jgi:hypothetical protein
MTRTLLPPVTRPNLGGQRGISVLLRIPWIYQLGHLVAVYKIDGFTNPSPWHRFSGCLLFSRKTVMAVSNPSLWHKFPGCLLFSRKTVTAVSNQSLWYRPVTVAQVPRLFAVSFALPAHPLRMGSFPMTLLSTKHYHPLRMGSFPMTLLSTKHYLSSRMWLANSMSSSGSLAAVFSTNAHKTDIATWDDCFWYCFMIG